MPLVSVVIPCYNVEGYIDDCLKSVFDQSYSYIEVICVDNNSSDNTWDKLVKWKEITPSIIIEKELKKGACAARNKGTQLSRGEFIQFLDADDLLLKDKIRNQVDLLVGNKESPFLVGAFRKKKVDGTVVEMLPESKNPFISLFTTKLGITSSNLWRAKSLKKIDGWDEDIYSSQEADLMFRLMMNNSNVVYSYSFDTLIQDRPFGQITKSNMEQNYIRYIDLRLRIIDYLSKEKIQIDEYYQLLFPKIREFYDYNKEMSVAYFKANFAKTFLPSVQYGNSKVYQILFKTFGFSVAEKIKIDFKAIK